MKNVFVGTLENQNNLIDKIFKSDEDFSNHFSEDVDLVLIRVEDVNQVRLKEIVNDARKNACKVVYVLSNDKLDFDFSIADGWIVDPIGYNKLSRFLKPLDDQESMLNRSRKVHFGDVMEKATCVLNSF